MSELSPERLVNVQQRIRETVGDEDQIAIWEAQARRDARNRRAKKLRDDRRKDLLVQGLKQACETWRDPNAPSLVYFLRCGDFVKVGFTTDMRRRLDGIMTDNPFELELIGCIRGPVQLETAAHLVFENHHHRREWFRCNSSVQRAIKLHARRDLETAFGSLVHRGTSYNGC
jgi:hypothetical protein